MIIPCIDLQDGKAVQLVRGRRLALSVDDVLGLLERFRDYPILHVIDLDAAMRKGSNSRWIKTLCARGKMKVRVGGGIRKAAQAEKILSWGAEKIIVGSAAFEDGKIAEKFLAGLAKRVGAKEGDRSARHRRRAHSGPRLAGAVEASPRRSNPRPRTLLLGIPLHLRRQRRHHEGHRPRLVQKAPPCHKIPDHRAPAESAVCAK